MGEPRAFTDEERARFLVLLDALLEGGGELSSVARKLAAEMGITHGAPVFDLGLGRDHSVLVRLGPGEPPVLMYAEAVAIDYVDPDRVRGYDGTRRIRVNLSLVGTTSTPWGRLEYLGEFPPVRHG